MNIPSILNVVIRAVLLPIVAMWLEAKFNLFSHIDIVPKDYIFESGFTSYLILLEAIYGCIVREIVKRKAKITCVFYKNEEEKNINNTPTIICKDTDSLGGVVYINCEIVISGNINRLKARKMELNIPAWLSSQISNNDNVLSLKGNMLVWDFDYLLPQDGTGNQFATYRGKIPFIKDRDESQKFVNLEPKLAKKGFNLLIEFNNNSFEVRS